MTNNEKSKRIKQAITETSHLLSKAKVKHQNSIICLKMEVLENQELGNDKTANKLAVEHFKNCKARVKELENHIVKLNKMLVELQ